MLIPTVVLFALWIGLGTARLRAIHPTLRTARHVELGGSPSVCSACSRRPSTTEPTMPPTRTPRSCSPSERSPFAIPLGPTCSPQNRWREARKPASRTVSRRRKPGAIILTDFNPGMALLDGQRVLGLRRPVARSRAGRAPVPSPTRDRASRGGLLGRHLGGLRLHRRHLQGIRPLANRRPPVGSLRQVFGSASRPELTGPRSSASGPASASCTCSFDSR